MSAEDIEYTGDYKEFPTKESALDWLDNYLSLDERNNLIRALQQDSTTKNDLGVDWENYKDADGNCLDDLILEVLQNNFDCGNTYGYKVADEIIELLPSVTPQPCEDAISRKAVINQIFYSTDNNGDVVLGSALRERIARLPSVTPQESRTGHWIGDSYGYICSNCEHSLNDLAQSMDYISFCKPKYCPNCGAKMESEG